MPVWLGFLGGVTLTDIKRGALGIHMGGVDDGIVKLAQVGS